MFDPVPLSFIWTFMTIYLAGCVEYSEKHDVPMYLEQRNIREPGVRQKEMKLHWLFVALFRVKADQTHKHETEYA